MSNIICKFCESDKVVKAGKKDGQQLYKCNSCNRRFVNNGNPERMREELRIIASALDMYYEGLSVRKVQRQLIKLYGVKVSQVSIWNWLIKYSELVTTFLDTVQATTLSEYWHVDETVIKCNGQNKWFWEIIDEETKFIVASHFSNSRTCEDSTKLFLNAKKKSTVRLKGIFSDGSYSYKRGFNKAFYTRYAKDRVLLIQNVGIRSRKTNNIVERLHSTLKDRVKVTRGLKGFDTVGVLLKGWVIHYNYIRPHQSLRGKTPAQVAGIDLGLENGWFDLINLAIKHKNVRGVL
jgi:transposase-like protein